MKANVPPLSRAEVFEACRALYDAAAEDFILPSLLRDIERFSTGLRRVYVVHTTSNRIRFCVELDKAFTETIQFPLARIPLLFYGTVNKTDHNDLERELHYEELRTLISALLLGVRLHILIKKDSMFPYYGISLQLSETLSVECGGLLDTDLAADMICHQVSMSLCNKSKDFFLSQREGLAVWSSRVAQEFFDAPRPSPENLWPKRKRRKTKDRDVDPQRRSGG